MVDSANVVSSGGLMAGGGLRGVTCKGTCRKDSPVDSSWFSVGTILIYKEPFKSNQRSNLVEDGSGCVMPIGRRKSLEK